MKLEEIAAQIIRIGSEDKDKRSLERFSFWAAFLALSLQANESGVVVRMVDVSVDIIGGL